MSFTALVHLGWI